MRERAFETFGLEVSKLELHETGEGRTLVGYASAFDYPMPGDQGETVVVRPNSFTKTLKENRDEIQVLYHHGKDPQIGDKPLGVPTVINQDKVGLWTETPLAPTSYNNDIVIPLLQSRALRGMSVSIGIMQQSWSDDHTIRYIEQVFLQEFGPTPFPRNLGATAALHSLSLDEFAYPLEQHWDGAAAMRSCDTAAEFRQIAFERSNDSDPDTAAHWTLPHHPRPGAGPDSAGVGAALAALHGGRGGTPDLKQSVASVEAHLTRHQSESSDAGDRSTDEAAASPNPDRLTWIREMRQKTELGEAEIERDIARLARLFKRRSD